MVLDNDSGVKREGTEVTYKRKKGFQPLHFSFIPGCHVKNHTCNIPLYFIPRLPYIGGTACETAGL